MTPETIDQFQYIKYYSYLVPRLRGIKQMKINVLFIAEPQEEFFCFILLSLGAKYEQILLKLVCWGIHFRSSSLIVSKLANELNNTGIGNLPADVPQCAFYHTCSQLRIILFNMMWSWRWVLPQYNDLYGKASPERGTFLRLLIYTGGQMS